MGARNRRRVRLGNRPHRRHQIFHNGPTDLRHADRPRLQRRAHSSVIDQPISGERWIGLRGYGATLNGNPIRVRECPTLADATIGTAAPDLFDRRRESWQQAAAAARQVVYGGDCYTYAQIAVLLTPSSRRVCKHTISRRWRQWSRKAALSRTGRGTADTGFRRHYRRLRRCAPSRGIAGSAALTFL